MSRMARTARCAILVMAVLAAYSHPTARAPATGTTTPANTTVHVATTATTYKPRTRCPSKESLISEFIRKSEYHFKVMQHDHQGYYKALKWNLDMAFKSLESQFGKSMTEVQEDMKKVLSQNTALQSQVNNNARSVQNQLTDMQTDLKKEMSRLEKLVNMTLPAACRGIQLNNACYTIIECNPRCNIKTATAMCSGIGATVAPLRTADIYTLVDTYRHELGIIDLYIDGSDAATGGTWLYHDGTPMSYSKWLPGQPNGGEHYIVLYHDGTMRDVTQSYTYTGVACMIEL